MLEVKKVSILETKQGYRTGIVIKKVKIDIEETDILGYRVRDYTIYTENVKGEPDSKYSYSDRLPVKGMHFNSIIELCEYFDS